MTTEEFIREIGKLGLMTAVRKINVKKINWIDIYKLTTGADVWVGTVDGTAQYDMDIDDSREELTLEVKAKLFDLMVEYARTPLEER